MIKMNLNRTCAKHKQFSDAVAVVHHTILFASDKQKHRTS